MGKTIVRYVVRAIDIDTSLPHAKTVQRIVSVMGNVEIWLQNKQDQC